MELVVLGVTAAELGRYGFVIRDSRSEPELEAGREWLRDLLSTLNDGMKRPEVDFRAYGTRLSRLPRTATR
jgi:hypothetical protein